MTTKDKITFNNSGKGKVSVVDVTHTTEIIIKKGQIKSVQQLRILADCLDTIEKTIGIKTVMISLDDMWWCKDLQQEIQIENFGRTPMERLLLKTLNIN